MQRFYFLPLVASDICPVSDRFLENAFTHARANQVQLIVAGIDIALPTLSDSWSAVIPDASRLLRQANARSRDRCRVFSAKVRRAVEQGAQARFDTIASTFAAWHEAVATLARLYDLTMLELRRGDANGKATAESIIFDSGRPVIVFPANWDYCAFDHVVIAWDDSRAAARAVADANHFLARARTVTLLSVSLSLGGSDEPPIGTDLAGVLRRQGINAELIQSAAHPSATGATLQEQALACGGNLLVMGAFGHSSLRSFVLGSATDAILADPRLPVLMSY